MCGRYYIDDEIAREIEKIVRQLDKKLSKEQYEPILYEQHEIYPAATAPVVIGSSDTMQVKEYLWGFPHFDKSSRVIFNARSESVLEKRMFEASVRERRCVIPATGFYEWNSNKDKYYFHSRDDSILWFAGFHHQNRFVILTTDANESMVKIHDRMPLLLEASELEQWIFDSTLTEQYLHKIPKLIEKEPVGQMSLFD